MPEIVPIPDLFPSDDIRTAEIGPEEAISVQALRYIVNELNNGLGVLLGFTHNVLECLERADPPGEAARRECCTYLHSAQEKITQLSILMPHQRRRRAQLPKLVDKLGAQPKDATILLVDDDEQIRSLYEMVLRQNGFTVIQASGSYQAIKDSKRHGRIDVLVTDLQLPDITGAELAAYLHLGRPDMKVILMSGDMPETLDSNAVLLIKPFVPPVLLAAVRDVLAN
jgi:CheY-like chemotaxis protein